ncbi:uncharacterized protein LOC108091936 isoform X2 [Drosophila ficusphila]|uniref:uncharacterized protein LOC108091936 isoform X2 n=1 Tax=Drosophila ficusphila TaxID=30025 RepID=UPI001C8B06B7|nr:uncharacterized protein LOC108091936 isoform X2 [Drosophila ficusphila]
MDLSRNLLLFLGFISMSNIFSICIPPNHCIEDMEDSDAMERFDYVLDKYEELKMKIPGKPIGLHGKVVTHGESEEQHLVFHYMDNTPLDVIQTCAFVVTRNPGECETIRTYCSAFLGRLPRPLLERQPIAVCDDGVRVAEEEPEPEDDPDADAEQGQGGGGGWPVGDHNSGTGQLQVE